MSYGRKTDLFHDGYGLRIWVVIVITISILGGFLGGIGAFAYHVSFQSCQRFGANVERDTKYDFWGEGCYVQRKDGTFIPTSNYRVNTEDN